MSTQHLVCHGAICQCKFGTTPDTLNVKSQSRHFINDNGQQKLIANTLDIGQPFKINTFGSCKMLNNGPCKPAVTAWQGFYEKVTLSNSGKPLQEKSTATCAVGAPGCIAITFHGQVAQPSTKNVAKANEEAQSQLNPLVNLAEEEEAVLMIPKK
jgi:hypothetical protein